MIPLLLCVICMFMCHWPLGLLFSKLWTCVFWRMRRSWWALPTWRWDGPRWIYRNSLGEHCPHEDEMGPDESTQTILVSTAHMKMRWAPMNLQKQSWWALPTWRWDGPRWIYRNNLGEHCPHEDEMGPDESTETILVSTAHMKMRWAPMNLHKQSWWALPTWRWDGPRWIYTNNLGEHCPHEDEMGPDESTQTILVSTAHMKMRWAPMNLQKCWLRRAEKWSFTLSQLRIKHMVAVTTSSILQCSNHWATTTTPFELNCSPLLPPPHFLLHASESERGKKIHPDCHFDI